MWVSNTCMRIISLKEKQFKSGTVVQAEGTYEDID